MCIYCLICLNMADVIDLANKHTVPYIMTVSILWCTVLQSRGSATSICVFRGDLPERECAALGVRVVAGRHEALLAVLPQIAALCRAEPFDRFVAALVASAAELLVPRGSFAL